MSLNGISFTLSRESVREMREICANFVTDLEYKLDPSLTVLLSLQNALEILENLGAKVQTCENRYNPIDVLSFQLK